MNLTVALRDKYEDVIQGFVVGYLCNLLFDSTVTHKFTQCCSYFNHMVDILDILDYNTTFHIVYYITAKGINYI